MLKLYRVTNIEGIDSSHETYLCVSTDAHEDVDDASIYKEKEDWMDFSDISYPLIDYTDKKVYAVSFSEETIEQGEEHLKQWDYRKNWILSKIDKWLLQQPEGISLQDYLLSKQNLNSSPYSLAISTVEDGTSKTLLQQTDSCPYCGEKYFSGLCLNIDCPAGSQLGLKIIENNSLEEAINNL